MSVYGNHPAKYQIEKSLKRENNAVGNSCCLFQLDRLRERENRYYLWPCAFDTSGNHMMSSLPKESEARYFPSGEYATLLTSPE